MTSLNFTKRFDVSEVPSGCRILNFAVDWRGNPLLLLQEGKPPEPPIDAPVHTRINWLNSPPKTHHLIHWEGASRRMTTFEGSTGLTTRHIQPFMDGWLLCEARGGRAVVYDGAGRPGRSFDLGDASQDVQTTPDGQIWVSYFDEGVYGGGIGGQQGVVCFDCFAHPIFKFFDFAEQHQLPFIDDCYSMNVANDNEVWLSYYSDFPLVTVKAFHLQHVWKEFGCMDGAFGLAREAVVFSKCYSRANHERPQLLRRALSETPISEPIQALDEKGAVIEGPFHTAARGSNFFLRTATAVYGIGLSDF